MSSSQGYPDLKSPHILQADRLGTHIASLVAKYNPIASDETLNRVVLLIAISTRQFSLIGG